MNNTLLSLVAFWGPIVAGLFAIGAAVSGALAGYAGTELSQRADAKIAAVNNDTEKLRNENLKLAAALLRLAPRGVTDRQADEMNRALEGVTGRFFVVSAGDSETTHFADLIGMALQKGGRLAGRLTRDHSDRPPGVFTFLVSAVAVPAGSGANADLNGAFKVLGVEPTDLGAGKPIESNFGPDVSPQLGDRLIFVSTKPLPPDSDVPVLNQAGIGQGQFYIQLR